MRIRTGRVFRQSSAAIVSAVLASGLQAGIIEFRLGEYQVSASAQAHLESHKESFAGTSTSTTFNIGASATAVHNTPESGEHFANGTAGASWGLTHQGARSTLSGAVGGVAEARSNGLETQASGTASLKLQFDLVQDANIQLVYDGTFGSDLSRFENGAWLSVGYLVGYESFNLVAGSYRIESSAGETVAGFDSYSSGLNYSLTAVPVPEPAFGTVVAFFGALFAVRRPLGRWVATGVSLLN